MKKVLIKNGNLLSPINGYHQDVLDLYIEDGVIQKIGKDLEVKDATIIDATGSLVTPGLIDIHTHCFPKAFLGLSPDTLGIERGATTILDAGSSGADNFEVFKKEYIDKAKTRVYALLNVSKEGLERGHELDDLAKIDRQAIFEIIKKYPQEIVGFKARASASVVGQMGIRPIEIAEEIAKEYQMSLTIHIGNYPPKLTDVLNLMRKDDICTHTFHGKEGGILRDGKIIDEALRARDRGVKFDVGHGVASFSFDVFKKAKALGFDADFISTDLHIENYEGPVYNLAAVLTKMLNCNEPLEDIITKVTSAPARHFKLNRIGELKEGYFGDISIMNLIDQDEVLVDSIGGTLNCTKHFELVKTIISKGESSEIFEHLSK